MQLSQDDKRALLALIWSLKPSDLSVLQASLNEASPSRIGTTKNSANDIFYSHLEGLGLALEIPLQLDVAPEASRALKTFMLTEEGEAELPSLMDLALHSGFPPRDSIVSAEAIRMLKQYADEGNAPSQSKLGLLYEQGSGVEADHAEALKWYHKAAELGDVMAHNNIGFMYFGGFGVAKDIDAAIKWFLKAADLGSTGAMDNLGELYSRGIGVTLDYSEAAGWFRKAADLGHGPAICKLGSLYSAGRGVPQDKVQALMWFTVGIAAGIDEAVQYRNSLVSTMSPDQVEEGEALARQWMAARSRGGK